jgi:cysteinyl-tRNA synthetase
VHNGFVNFGDEKMSKSLGNVVLVHDLIERIPGEAIRWALLSAHYRQPLSWTEDLIEQSVKALDRLYGALRRAADVEAPAAEPGAEFVAALEDDLNTPRAYAELFAMAGRLETAKGAARAQAKAELVASARLMGFLDADPEAWFQGGADHGLKARVQALIAERATARAAKDWAAADRIRDELTALDVEIMDGPAGASWRFRARTS